MFARPAAKALSTDALQSIGTKLDKQEIVSGSRPRTTDANFPMFKITPGGRDLIYIPNHTYEDEEGVLHMKEDLPNIHKLNTEERRTDKVRCINGIVDESLGFTGECPVCEAARKAGNLATLLRNNEARVRGIDDPKNNKDNPVVKEMNRKYFGNKVVGDPILNHTFPVCVIETVTNSASKREIVMKDGVPVFNTYFMTLSDAHMHRNVFAAVDEYLKEEEGTATYAGLTINFTMGSSDGDKVPDMMTAAKDMKAVVARNQDTFTAEQKAAMDAASAAFSPEKAREVIFDNQIYPLDALEAAMQPIIEKMEYDIAIAEKVAASPVPTAATSLDDLVSGGTSAAGEVTAGLLPDDEVDAAEATDSAPNPLEAE